MELAANCRGVTSERGTALMLLTAGTGLALRSVSHGFLAGAPMPAAAHNARARDAGRARQWRARCVHTGHCMAPFVWGFCDAQCAAGAGCSPGCYCGLRRVCSEY